MLHLFMLIEVEFVVSDQGALEFYLVEVEGIIHLSLAGDCDLDPWIPRPP